MIAISGQTGELVPLYCTSHGKALLTDFNEQSLKALFGDKPLLVAEDEMAIETLAVLFKKESTCGARTVVHCRRCLWSQDVKASLFYRIAAVLLLLFSVGHTLGFRQSDPTWGVDMLLGSMQSIHFDVQGFSRTYWDLFVAAGFSVGVFYLFAAVLAWQLGRLPAETLAVMRVTVWALALCFAAITVVSWRYLFILPIVFSIVITVCLTAAAWLSAKPI